ncbi:MAG: YigZ family protein [Candidatus Eisenbacteria sp.]|nr:YigZ family protein [Candidatus Eisenbacteria bacterium]
MSETHLWLAGGGCAELIVRKSRFLGYALGCKSEQEARESLHGIRREHSKANHHVYSWRLRDAGTGQLTYRFDDDGEPGGTAGRPLLQVMESQRVVNALLVVVRYFGGIKLGTGGLVRAYSETAVRALAEADLQPLIPMRKVTVRIAFHHLSSLEHLIEREGIAVLDRRFETDALLSLEVPKASLAALVRELAELTHGAATVEEEATGNSA